MKVFTFFLLAAVLISVALAEEAKSDEKEKVWYHAPILKKPWKAAMKCFKEFKVEGCLDSIRNEFGEGAKILIEKHIKTHPVTPEIAP